MAEIYEKEMSWEDHIAAAIKSFRKDIKARRSNVLPEEFWAHRRAARREMLMAFRSLLDSRIEKLEHPEQEKSAQQVTRIKVE